MNVPSNNAAGFGAISFGDPRYFALSQVDRSGRDVSYQTLNAREMANYLGLNKTRS